MHSASLNKRWSLMKSVMQMKIRNELKHPVSRARFSLCRRETVRYAGSQQLLRHSSSSLKPCHQCNWLLNSGQKHSAVWSEQPTNAHYVETVQAAVAMTVLKPSWSCKCSGHDWEFGTAIPWAITPQQSSVSTHCLLKSVSDPDWPVNSEVRDISSLNCTIKQSM